jgi:indolepyruvate decarboxylase
MAGSESTATPASGGFGPTAPASVEGMTIGDYLIRRLLDYGIRDVFGIPGDYVLSFYAALEKSRLNVVGCTREDCAGYAADAYARVNGMGAVCVTYCVGGLSVCNSIAGAFAEKSPVVVISGSPGLNERTNNPLLHHKVRDFRTQMEVFERLCIAGSELSDPMFAFREIDRVLDSAARYKRPVYLELPRDMAKKVPSIGHTYQYVPPASDKAAVEEAVAEAAKILSASKRPVILAGVEIHRFGLQDQLLSLAERAQIPIAATMLGKSVIRETHPLYVGLYEGGIGRHEVARFVEESDCVLMLGTFMTDINLGIYTANLDPARCIYATSETLRIRHHHYHDVLLHDFIEALSARKPSPAVRQIPADVRPTVRPFRLEADAPIAVTRLIEQLNEALADDTIVIAEPGDSLFAATELITHQQSEFLSPAYYTSMGFGVPAAIGAQMARREQRVVVIAGDGAFQMTGMELSTAVKYGLAPIVIVLDNQGYGTERCLHPGDWKYNDIHGWHYARLPELLGGGTGYDVHTEGQFAEALDKAFADTAGFSLIHVHIRQDDFSRPLTRLGERLRQRV